jgi:hypothetical protein
MSRRCVYFTKRLENIDQIRRLSRVVLGPPILIKETTGKSRLIVYNSENKLISEYEENDLFDYLLEVSASELNQKKPRITFAQYAGNGLI